jgi:isopropylmalate/homocitrate/citramalate synthase
VTETKTLFVKFDSSVWTETELNQAMELMGDALGDDIEVVALADDIEFMTQDQVNDLIETLIEVSEGEEQDAEA